MDLPQQKTVIIICGPTAAGKTAAAIEVAWHFKTSIISADSRQCYRELNIGVARPSEQELAAVPHYFIASHSIHEEVNAITFESFALQQAAELFQQHNTIVMVGGTGLYIKAFCEGLDRIPPVDPAIRATVMQQYETNGIGWLQQQLIANDPQYSQQGEMQNPQRMMRALEVVLQTGESILSFQTGEKAKRDFVVRKIGLQLTKEELHHHIHRRVDQMIGKGLVDEVRSLLPYRSLNALRTVGYSEIFAYLDGMISLEKAIEQVKTNTRHYAKRQMTWFKKDDAIQWFRPDELPAIITALQP